MERIQIAVSLHIVSFVAFRILPSADAGQPLERLITDHPEHPEHGDTAPPRVPRDVSARRHGVDVRRRPLSARDDRFREFTKHGVASRECVEGYLDRVWESFRLALCNYSNCLHIQLLDGRAHPPSRRASSTTTTTIESIRRSKRFRFSCHRERRGLTHSHSRVYGGLGVSGASTIRLVRFERRLNQSLLLDFVFRRAVRKK